MVFAVAMTFIDQTIVAIAIPNIEKELSLSVFYIMAGVMLATFIVTARWLPRGRVAAIEDEPQVGVVQSPV